MPITRGTMFRSLSCFLKQITEPIEAKHSFQSARDADKSWDRVLDLELLPQHEQKSEKSCVNSASLGEIDHDLLLRSYRIPKAGNRFVHVAGDGRAGETQGDAVTAMSLLDDQIMSAALASPPLQIAARWQAAERGSTTGEAAHSRHANSVSKGTALP